MKRNYDDPSREKLALEHYFLEVYTKFKLSMYRKIFSSSEDRKEGLSAMENFCAETIYALNGPTVHEFASFVHISAPNAAYKIHNLIRKGYVVKIRSKEDRREYHLEVTEKYLREYGLTYDYVEVVMKRIRERFSEEDARHFEEILRVISEELMSEVPEGIQPPQD